MKYRNALVSNSSSTSFIIAFKNNKTLKDIKLPKLLTINNEENEKINDELEWMIKNIILDSLESPEPISIERFIDVAYGYQSIESYYNVQNKKQLKKIKHMFAEYYLKNYKIVYGSFKDAGEGGSGIEQLLSYLDVDIETEDFIFKIKI